MNDRDPRIRAVSLSLGLCVIATPLILLPSLGSAASRAVTAPGILAQAASGPGKVKPRIPENSDAKPSDSRKIAINVFLFSDDPDHKSDEILESRGSRYIYFDSPKLRSSVRPLGEPRPVYPDGKKAELGGAVLLQLLINERGGLDHIDVICSAPAFEASAISSVRDMKFTPARDENGPVKSYMWVEFAYGRGFPCASVPE